MVDLTREMAELMSALGRPQGQRGRVLMFVSALSGEGVSTVAREFARCEAAFAKKPVWLIDADMKRQGQMIAFGQDPARFGPPGALSQATPDGSAFFTLTPPALGKDGKPIPDAKYLIARPFLAEKLWVTRFNQQNLAPGQRVKLLDEAPYWKALRAHAQTVVIDAPAADRSGAALQLASQVDGVIMVVSEDEGDVQARLNLKNDIDQVGGRLIGMVYNRASRAGKGPLRRMSRFAAL